MILRIFVVSLMISIGLSSVSWASETEGQAETKQEERQSSISS